MGKKGGDQEVVNRTELDAKSQAYLDNYRRSLEGVARPAINGTLPSMIPGVDPMTQQGQAALGGLNKTSPEFDAMRQRYAALGGNLGLGSDILTELGQGDVSRFYDPYEQQVIGGVQSDYDRQRQQAAMAAADQATKDGAFGGSRSAILNAELQGGVSRDEASKLAQLRSQGYNDSYSRGLAVAGANANLGLAGQEGIGNAEAFQKNLDAQRAAGLISAGDYNRQIKEQQMSEQWNRKLQGLGILGAGTGMGGQVNYGPSQSGSPLMGAAGGALTGFGVGGPIGAAVGGGIGLLGGLFDW